MPKQNQVVPGLNIEAIADGLDPCNCKKNRKEKYDRCHNCGCPNCDNPQIRPGDPRAERCIWAVRTLPGGIVDLPVGFPQIGDARFLKCQGLNKGDKLAPPWPKPDGWREPIPPVKYDEDVFPSIPKYRRDEQGFETLCDNWRACLTEGYNEYKKCVKACNTPGNKPTTKPPTGTR